jgi:hypothetical protein
MSKNHPRPPSLEASLASGRKLFYPGAGWGSRTAVRSAPSNNGWEAYYSPLSGPTKSTALGVTAPRAVLIQSVAWPHLIGFWIPAQGTETEPVRKTSPDSRRGFLGAISFLGTDIGRPRMMPLETAVSDIITAMSRRAEIDKRIALLESEVAAKRSEIDALKAERSQIVENLKPLEDINLIGGGALEATAKLAPSPMTEPSSNASAANGRVKNKPVPPMPQSEFETVATEIITRNGLPMQAAALREAFYMNGHPIPGVNPRENFNTKVTRARSRLVLRNTTDGLWPRKLRKPKGAHWLFY